MNTTVHVFSEFDDLQFDADAGRVWIRGARQDAISLTLSPADMDRLASAVRLARTQLPENAREVS